MIFKEIKGFDDEERWLLIKAFEIITKYGSIGGKTIFKPSENKNKNTSGKRSRNYRLHHQDFGLMEKKEFPPLPRIDREKIKEYVKRDGKTNENRPDLRYFWFVSDKYIKRDKHNEIVGRDPNNPKRYKQDANAATDLQKWLGGDQGKSKKIFSFYTHQRCWGYAKANEYAAVIGLITKNNVILEKDITKGEGIINGL